MESSYTSFGQTNTSSVRCNDIYGKKGHIAKQCRHKGKKGDGLKGGTSFTKGQGNPWANKDSNSGSESSGPSGWFKPLKGEPR
jgi:hypothetical protein